MTPDSSRCKRSRWIIFLTKKKLHYVFIISSWMRRATKEFRLDILIIFSLHHISRAQNAFFLGKIPWDWALPKCITSPYFLWNPFHGDHFCMRRILIYIRFDPLSVVKLNLHFSSDFLMRIYIDYPKLLEW